MKDSKAQEIENRLALILGKAELDTKEMRWLLSYLEEQDGQALKDLARKLFEGETNNPATGGEDHSALKQIWQHVSDKLFGTDK